VDVMVRRETPRVWVVWLVVGASWWSNAVPALAKLCGDQIRGRDVPCACGDTVASDVVLTDDPVVRTVCPREGLIIHAEGDGGLTVDLAGNTLRGSHRGTGLWVVYGGSGGAYIVSTGGTATIEGFRDGISAFGADSLAVLDGVRVLRSARDGVRVHAQDYEVRNVESLRSGRDGIAVLGGGFRVSNTLAVDNVRHGYFVMGRDGTLGLEGASVVARFNGGHGLVISGERHRLTGGMTSANNRDGIQAHGNGLEISAWRAEDNLGDGITGGGLRWRLQGNRAENNGLNGLLINGGVHEDAGDNSGFENGSLYSRVRPVAQCQISGWECQP
jgi:hypothetical protein